MGKNRTDGLARRDLLKTSTALGILSSAPLTAAAQTSSPPSPARATPAHASAPIERDEHDPDTTAPSHVFDRPGSDYMVDVIKALGIEYVAANCGSSFRSLQESITVYGENRAPEYLTCLHEEASAAMAHGYSKVAGKPMAILAHNTVGLQHASMAIFNAYCDRAPMLIFAGNTLDATQRRGGAEWYHSDSDPAAFIRGFIKWDDNPVSLAHFAESTARAYRIAMTAPMGPAVISIDKKLQEAPSSRSGEPALPRFPQSIQPSADPAALDTVARMLVEAASPVLLADRLTRTQAGLNNLVALAELLQAPVVCPGGSPLTFPQLHALNQSDDGRRVIAAADVIVGLEMIDLWSSLNRLVDGPVPQTRRIARADAKVASIGMADVFIRGGAQTFQRYQEVDLAIAADAETALPYLLEAVRRRLPRARQSSFNARGQRFAEAKRRRIEQYWSDARYGWDGSPISTPRLAYEVWKAIEHKDWSLTHAPRAFTDFWDKRLPYHDLGRSGGSGVGYGAPASVGAALANKALGRFSVTIQPDGDLMFSPGVLWTAAHHKIPLLSVMHNNRAYHQEVMHLQRMACEHNRGIDACTIGTTLDNPFIDYAKLAQSMGVYAEGPITDPAELPAALRRAVAIVERGEPALLDVVTQPR